MYKKIVEFNEGGYSLAVIFIMCKRFYLKEVCA